MVKASAFGWRAAPPKTNRNGERDTPQNSRAQKRRRARTSLSRGVMVGVLFGIHSACSLSSSPPHTPRVTATLQTLTEETAAVKDTFRLLTYNVAGLPEGISRSSPRRNIPRISPLLNAYDIVVAQEDFTYHDELRAQATHKFIAEPSPWTLTGVGDGLSRFSRLPFASVSRTEWSRCSGTFGGESDCLAAKGFSLAHHEMALGVGLDVYNVHMDAGGSSDDRAARLDQLAQLEEAIFNYSSGRAVIIAGDTNIRGESEEQAYSAMLKRLALIDACRELSCPNPQSIDRIAYRSGGGLGLQAMRWSVENDFRTFSDHDAIAVEFKFTPDAPPREDDDGTRVANRRSDGNGSGADNKPKTRTR